MSNLPPDFDGLIFHLAYCGLLTLLCCDWFAHFHTDANGIFYADLIEYCNGVSTKISLALTQQTICICDASSKTFCWKHKASSMDWLWVLFGVKLELMPYLLVVQLIGGRRMGMSVLLLACVAAP